MLYLKYRHTLALVWFAGGAMLFALVFLMSVRGALAADPAAGWQWMLPNIMPTLTLIASSYMLPVPGGAADRPRPVVAQFFRIALGLSVFYLLAVLATMAVWPLRDSGRLADWLSLSNLWLGPLQGLAVAAIGVFFVRQASDD